MDTNSATASASDKARAPGVGMRQRKLSLRASTLNVRRQGMYGTDETVAELESLINSGSSRGAAPEVSPAYPTPTSLRSPGASRHGRMRSECSASAILAPSRTPSVDAERRPRPTHRLTPAQELAQEYRR
ncbi:hypothetical protein HDZ31DRAFT_77796, partial [Schizophyllum fasciatum]